MNLPSNAESALQREILDALPALVFLERGGWIVFANAEALDAMGAGGERWMPRRTEEVLWGLFPGVAEPQTALAGSRGGSPFHATLAGRGGRIIPVEGTYSILDAELREGIIVAQVSARERAPKPRLMEDVLASLPEAVAIVHGGRVLYVNAAFTRMFGFAEDEAIGRDLRELIVPETRLHENAVLQRALEDGGRVSMETVRMNKGGDLIDVAMQVAPLVVNGTAAGYVLSYRDIADRKQLEAQLQQDALYDILTGLPNRAVFQDRLKLALSRRERKRDQNCGVLLVDFDRFQEINASLGHAAGDLLLMSAAGRLRGALRPHDTAARNRGDEFAVLVECVPAIADLEVVAQRVQRDLGRPFDLLGHRVEAAISMGVAISSDERCSAEALMRDADLAMQRAKQAGGNRYEVATGGAQLAISGERDRQRQLRRVLDQRQIELWYEPILRLATGVVDGFEAVPRWRRDDGSMDMLQDLHGVADDNGFAAHLGRETMELVCRQIVGWNGDASGSALFVSMDLTQRQFYQDDLAAQIEAVLAASKADPGRLLLEIAENVLCVNPDRAIAILQRIVDTGVRIAVDHCGAGLAPLNHLIKLPVDTVKLDPGLTASAMAEGGRPAVLESVIHVAKSVGLQVVAQGVESRYQLALFQEMGCDLAQGPLLSQALEPVEALKLAATDRPWMALHA